MQEGVSASRLTLLLLLALLVVLETGGEFLVDGQGNALVLVVFVVGQKFGALCGWPFARRSVALSHFARHDGRWFARTQCTGSVGDAG